MEDLLSQLISEFSGYNSALADPVNAKGHCIIASNRFADMLVEYGFNREEHGLEVWDIVLDDEHERHYCPEWYPNIVFEGHCVVHVLGRVIDWTARQYNPSAPFPLVFTVNELPSA